MTLQATAIMIGGEDLARSRKPYGWLGVQIEQDYPNFVSLNL